MNRLLSLTSDARLRFIAAGGLASGIAWSVRVPLGLVMPFPAAVVLATAVGMVVGFLLYRSFVFTEGGRNGEPAGVAALLRQIGRFVLVNLAGGVLTLLVAVLARQILIAAFGGLVGIDGAAHALGIAAGAVLNYAGHKFFTFRRLA